MFATFGVTEELSSDGGPEFVSKDTGDCLERWGERHRISSTYHPRSNGRDAVAVKAMKRLLLDNVCPNGDVDSEAYVRALLQFRNTPDADSGLSPAVVVFGRVLRDVLPVKPGTQIFENRMVKPEWREIWQRQEEALRQNFVNRIRFCKPILNASSCGWGHM